jgi:hypothetical protein
MALRSPSRDAFHLLGGSRHGCGYRRSLFRQSGFCSSRARDAFCIRSDPDRKAL